MAVKTFGEDMNTTKTTQRPKKWKKKKPLFQKKIGTSAKILKTRRDICGNIEQLL